MQLWDLFGGRRREQALRDAIAELKTATQEACEAADDARRVADQSGHLLTRLESVVRSNEEPPIGPKRVVILSLIAALCLSLAIVAAILVPAAFTDPSATVSDPGAVQVLIESAGTPQANQEIWVDGAIIAASYSQSDQLSTAYYTLYFPKKFFGRKFVLALSGSAVLTKPQGTKQEITNRPGNCHSYQGGDLRNFEQACQLLGGVVRPDDALGLPECGNPSTSQLSEYVYVFINGTTQPTTAIDWAHRQTSLPPYYQFSTPDAVSDYSGLPLEGTFTGIRQQGCKSLDLSSDLVLTDLSENPTRSTGRKVTWTDTAAAVAVVSKTRKAEGTGNILLAVVGVLAGLGIGLVPVAYGAGVEWRRGVRRKRLAAESPSDDADLPGPNEAGG